MLFGDKGMPWLKIQMVIELICTRLYKILNTSLK